MEAKLYTDRFLLREIVPADAPALLELDSDPEVHRYLGGHTLSTLEEVQGLIGHLQRQYAEFGIGRWGVEDRQTGEFLGWAGLKWITEPVNGHVHIYDLGYRILRRHWGKGIATECALACRDYAFREMGLSELYAAAHVDNTASNKILTRIGMRLAGRFRFEGEGCNWYEGRKIT